MIYFTSDLHLGHCGIIRMQNRPFEDVDEMNRTLIQNYNAVVHKGDTAYLLGDICYHLGTTRANEMIGKLNGKKILIRGNHDINYDPSLFEEICDFKTISMNGQNIALMHYPMLSWPKSQHGSLHLHGHMHNDMSYNEQNREEGIRRYDVGVDANYYYPVSLLQILQFFGING